MTIIALFFIILNGVTLLKGGFFRETLIQIGELSIKQEQGRYLTSDEKSELIVKGVGVWLLAIFCLILQAIFYTWALKIDVYTYPTLFMLIWLITSLIITFGNYKKKDLKDEKGAKEYRKSLYKGRTLKVTLSSIAGLLYFAYMFYVIVFML